MDYPNCSDLQTDEFFECNKKSTYTDGWPEDKWEEEMAKHPFFMTKAPDPTEELSPLLEGLQQLKYDETENSPDELANTYKTDGNVCFKRKKYRDAIVNYSTGLKLKCSDEIKAQLYNNRAAAHYFLRNYRSALNDSLNSLKLKTDYLKADVRIAQCHYHLENYEDCLKACDDILSRNIQNTTIVDLRKDAVNKRKIKDRNSRKNAKSELKKISEENYLLETISKRKTNIKLLGKRLTSLSQLEPDNFPDIQLKRVHLYGDRLVWPVMLQYPEHEIFDFILEFNENTKFADHLHEIFLNFREWDVDKKYSPDNVNIYFKNQETYLIVPVSINSTLKEILTDSKYTLTAAVPSFLLFAKNTQKEKDFLACLI